MSASSQSNDLRNRILFTVFILTIYMSFADGHKIHVKIIILICVILQYLSVLCQPH